MMKSVPTNLDRLDEIIARQYEDKIRGFAKDSIQNSWEARINKKKGTGFQMVYRIYKNLDGHGNVLMFEDFETVGMNEERWKAFHSHWFSTKGGSYSGGIGRWGQGKTLYLYYSSINTIITESIDSEKKKYRYSIRNNAGYLEYGDKPAKSDPKWMKKPNGNLKLINDIFPSIKRLDHIGTRIWVLNVKDELAEEIVSDYLTQQISESWWELIRNYKIGIKVCIYGKNGTIETKQVGLPAFPPDTDSIVYPDLSIGAGHGKIKKLKFVIAQNPITPRMRGIAIQRGHMSVLRYELPVSIPEDIKERAYGYCMLDDKLDEQMWEIELANHEGFESRKAVWNRLRSTIDSQAEKFFSKYTTKKKVEPVKMDLEEIIRTVNKIVDEHLSGLGTGTKHKSGKPGRPLPPVRISPWGYYGTSKRFDAKDIMQIKGRIENTTDAMIVVHFSTWIQRYDNHKVWIQSTKKMKLAPYSQHAIHLPDVEFPVNDISPGRCVLKAEIKDDKKETLHERSAVFYYEQDPPLDTGGWLKKLLFDQLGGPKNKLRNLPINKDGELLINIAHPEISRIWFSAQLGVKDKARRLVPIIVNICLHEAIRETNLKWWEDESINYDIPEIKRTKDLFDEMWADYLIGQEINA